MQRDISKYESYYRTDYGFESVMVFYRMRLLLERLNLYSPKVVIEIGCGSELLYQHYLDQGGSCDQWIIVEPCDSFVQIACDSNLPNLKIIHGLFEEVVEKNLILQSISPSYIICSSLLHEVSDEQRLLSSIKSIMTQGSILHVNVPNASSVHRRLAQSMGIIKELNTLSERNLNLQQYRVYDLSMLIGSLKNIGFTIKDQGGYLVKPFTHKQMEIINREFGDSIIDGLYVLGKDYPDLASEIFVESHWCQK